MCNVRLSPCVNGAGDWKSHSEQVGVSVTFLSCDWCKEYKHLEVKKNAHLKEDAKEFLSVWADAISKTLRFLQRTSGVISHLLHARPRHHLSPKPNRVFPRDENMSDTNNLPFCATRVKGDP